jgi:hypothetical protein
MKKVVLSAVNQVDYYMLSENPTEGLILVINRFNTGFGQTLLS